MPETLRNRMLKRIQRKRGDVFLRKDFRDLGGYDSVGRVLRALTAEGKILKLGHGVYSRAERSPWNDQLYPPKGLQTLTEALHRLGVETGPASLERDYNAGRTTQVPTGRVVAVRGRVSRKLGYNGIYLSYERTRSKTH